MTKFILKKSMYKDYSSIKYRFEVIEEHVTETDQNSTTEKIKHYIDGKYVIAPNALIDVYKNRILIKEISKVFLSDDEIIIEFLGEINENKEE